MWLDAAFYTGSENWLDNSGNSNNAIFVNPDNAITWVNTFSGVFQSTGNSGNYLRIPSISLYNTDYTIIGASRFLNPANPSHRIITSSNNWFLGHWNDTVLDYYVNDGFVHGPEGSADTQWRIYAGTGSLNTSPKNFKFYVNGTKLADGPSPDGANVGHGPQEIQLLGESLFNETTNGQIGFLLVYNRILSDTEILNIFNTYRSRYGL